MGGNNSVAGLAVLPGGFPPLRSGNTSGDGSSGGQAGAVPTTEVVHTLWHMQLTQMHVFLSRWRVRLGTFAAQSALLRGKASSACSRMLTNRC